MALLHLEGHADRLEADPCIEPLAEPRPFAQALQGVERDAVEQAEIAGAFRQVDFAEGAEQPVKKAGQPFARRRIRLAAFPDAINVLVALAPFGDKFANSLRGMLEVGVHDHRAAAARSVDAGSNGDFLAEIA